jgi:hypothetical protein
VSGRRTTGVLVASSQATRLFRIDGRRQLGLKFDRRRGFMRWEAASLRAMIDAGVRAPAPLAVVGEGTGAALLYEWVDANPEATLTRGTADDGRRLLARIHRTIRGPLPSAEALTLREVLRSSRPGMEREWLAKLLLRTVDGFGRGYGAAHGDFWPGNLLATVGGDAALLDPKLHFAPRCFDLASYCFHAPAELVPESMLDDLEAAGRTTRVVAVARELARCPHVPAPEWIEWALHGGRPPAPSLPRD